MRVDLLIANVRVFGTEASTVAVTDDKIAGIDVDPGDVSAASVIDADGGLVIPGFQDAHVHPTHGGLVMISCDLTAGQSIADYRQVVAEYAASGDGWITGGGWSFTVFPGGLPDRGQLDDVTRGRPAFLMVSDGHAAWANSAALQIAGITSSTPDPPDGRIERDIHGEPTGCLQEGAMTLVERHVPEPTTAMMREALLTAQDHLLALGVVSWQDAMVDEITQAAYLAADEAGELMARVRGALWWERERGDGQIPDLVERRRARSKRFFPDSVKLMLDGVCENFTASMLDPYLNADGELTDNRGIDFIDPEELGSYVASLHDLDFQVHFHALGDRAVRNALDSIEFAVAQHGPKDLRHHLAHIQVVDQPDVSRFGELGAIANAQPLWAVHDDAMDVLTTPFLIKGTEGQYIFRSIRAAGGRLAMGSDWPVSSADPLEGIEVAVHRKHSAVGDRPLLPAEALAAAEAMEAYTGGSAYASHFDCDSGRIAPGFRADLVVLDGDPLSDRDFAGRSVTHTIVGGELAYSA